MPLPGAVSISTGQSHLRFSLSSVQLSTDSHSLAFAGTRPTSTGGTALWAPAGGRVTFLLRDKKVTKESRPASSAWLRQAPLPLPLPAGRRCNSPAAQIVSPSTAGLPRPSRTSLGDSEGEKGTLPTLQGLSGGKEIQMRLPCQYRAQVKFGSSLSLRPLAPHGAGAIVCRYPFRAENAKTSPQAGFC